jgi:hypothetical protein
MHGVVFQAEAGVIDSSEALAAFIFIAEYRGRRFIRNEGCLIILQGYTVS